MVVFRLFVRVCVLSAVAWPPGVHAQAETTKPNAVAEATTTKAENTVSTTEQAAQARREAGAVSPETLAAAKKASREANAKKVRSGGTSTKFGSLEGLADDELVCRNEKKTGSRLVKQACYSVGDIRAYRARLREISSLPGQASAAGLTETRGDGL